MRIGGRVSSQAGTLAPSLSVTLALAVALVVVAAPATPTQASDAFTPPGTELVRLPIPDRATLSALHRIGIEPEEADRTHMTFRVTPDELAGMQRLGLDPEPWEYPTSPDLLLFTSYDQMVTQLTQAVTDHPAITELTVIGQTVQGRNIYAIKITDNPDAEEAEPEVRIVGAHHGNEQMSTEICLNLVDYLTDGYGFNSAITRLVNGREIWIVPMVNPDGYVANQRTNAHAVDINRNYGYMWQSGGSSYFSEPETRAMHDLATENWFSLSLSLHCSGDYVNSVWNYSPIYTEDDDVVWNLTVGYAAYNGYTPIRGWYWYETHGDCNDWSYGARSDIDWTIEFDNFGETAVWNENRDAIMYLIDKAGMGLHGTVIDAETGEPLRARVDVMDRSWPVFTDPAVGDYHKPLLAGTYTVRFTANGHQELVVPGVVVPAGGATLNVQLQPGGGYYADRVEVANVADPTNSYNNTTLTMSMLGAPDDVGCSLGRGGNAVVDLGPGSELADNPGLDLVVHESSEDAIADGFRVYGGNSYLGPWTLIGGGTGTTGLDLAGTGITTARYLRIVDDNDGSSSDPHAGFEIDAFEVLGLAVGVPDLEAGIAPGAWLGVPRPNPVRTGDGVTLDLGAPLGSEYRLDVLDVTGRLIRNLVHGATGTGGQAVYWSMMDLRDRRAAPGVYFLRLTAADRAVVRKLTVVP